MLRPSSKSIRWIAVLLPLALLLAGAFLIPNRDTHAQAGPRSKDQLLRQLRTATNGNLATSTDPALGTYDFVRTTGDAVLLADDPALKPEDRALGFLRTYGTLMGIADPAGQLQHLRTMPDAIGMQHVRYSQVYKGLPVFGTQVIVHMADRGITALNGTFIPDINVDTTPTVAESVAARRALAVLHKAHRDLDLRVANVSLAIYRTGLLEGRAGENRLAYAVEVGDGKQVRQQVWIDAGTGAELNHISLVHEDLHRIVYSPTFDPDNPNQNKVREEGDPPIVPPPLPRSPYDRLYDFTGQTYDLFFNAFGRDSYDDGVISGTGAVMRTVYLINQHCPNAYWNGVSTNYCPGFDLDDVVAHEWGHAYTEYSNGLIYQFQSGALNESYSDVWGETLDLHNGQEAPVDGLPTGPDDEPYPDGERWLVGEDLVDDEVARVLLRNMWDPTTHPRPPFQGDPDRVGSPNYYCDFGDQGGVHTNSGVPNHAFAILTDGTARKPDGMFNGQTISPGLGFTKTVHIYYQASLLLEPASNFQDNADALEQACNDLRVAGTDLKDFTTGAPSGEVITQDDCDKVAAAIAAVEMRLPPSCEYGPQLPDPAPAFCPAGTQVSSFFAEDFTSDTALEDRPFDRDGAPGLTGDDFDPDRYKWVLTDTLPAPDLEEVAVEANVALAPNFDEGTCEPGGDISGSFWMDTPEIEIASVDEPVLIRFDHFMQAELNYDGGNLKISVNGGPYTVITPTLYTANPPTRTIAAGPFTPPPEGPDLNTNPMAGQAGWHGTDAGEARGSWGTSVVDLSPLVESGAIGAGTTIRLRWEFGTDGCGGITGWFVDNINVYACVEPAQATPTATGTVVVPSVTATAAVPSVTATGIVPSVTATGVLPSVTVTGIVPSVTATGVLPSVTATGIIPSVTTTGTAVATGTGTVVATGTATAQVTGTLTGTPEATGTARPTGTATMAGHQLFLPVIARNTTED